MNKFLAKQLKNPSGLFGRFILARLWNSRNVALNDLTLECLALSPHDRVLEIGFGGGYLLGRMAQALTGGLLAGVDVSPTLVAACQRRYDVEIQAGRLKLCCTGAESLPYPAEHFTKICSVNSLFYWQDAPLALAECWRVLKPGGLLVLCFTAKSSLATPRFAQDGITLYEVPEVQHMLDSAGFSDLQVIQRADRHREFFCVLGTRRQ